MALLSKDEEARIKKNAALKMSRARCSLIQRSPFIGPIIMGLELVPVRDSRLDTAATDGRSIFFDVEFLSTLSEVDIQFVMAHETWHCLMNHFGRMRGPSWDAKLANIAQDIEVNEILKEDGLTPLAWAWLAQNIGSVPKLSAEEYYKILANQKQQKRPMQPGTGAKARTADGKPNNNSYVGQGKLDEHIKPGEGLDDGGGGRTKDKYGSLGHDSAFSVKMSEEELAEAFEAIRHSAIASAEEMLKQRGELPGHIAKIVSDLTTPTIRWETVLTDFVTRAFGMSQRTYLPPNKRWCAHNICLPSRHGVTVKFALGIDTSGSTNNDLPRFLSELNGLLSTFSGYEMILIHCDTEVRFRQTFQDGEFDFTNTDHVTLRGGGGTVLHPIIDAANEEDVDVTIIFTDGYCEEFNEDNTHCNSQLLWVVSSDGSAANLKTGRVIQLDKQ